ncbi:MAG: di-trans,poly-cis-decaprenylcistransferase [Oligoflexia bacterium]|nr:di-trans,poly-cis-decaprenylcistransferase [Oligoflexia bacterium]
MNGGSNGVPRSNFTSAATPVPRHVAIIMDGNGRWARARHLPRVEGHRRGAKTVRMVVEESRRLGIRYLTLFAFSTENWNRPPTEVAALMQLFKRYLESEMDLLLKNQIRLRAIGDLARLPQDVQESLAQCQAATADQRGMDLILAVSYGGREEIASAARRLAHAVQKGELDPSQIDINLFSGQLYGPDIPDPDLLIRTSDECRISNFLLWQLAYAEIVVSPVFWPEFSKDEYLRCLERFSSRIRRFGLTDEQLAEFRQ